MEVKYMQQLIVLHRRLLIDNQTSSNDTYEDDSELDSNMVIILTFLLCALLFTIGLNAFARYGGLHFFRRSSEQSVAPGLKKRALRQLPEAVYGSGPHFSINECPICLGEFLDGERIRVLPKCGHGFHVECIDTWLISNGSCPNCRVSLLERPLPPSPPLSDRQVALNIWGH